MNESSFQIRRAEPGDAEAIQRRCRAVLVGCTLALGLVLTSGCATPALWRGTAGRHWAPQQPHEVLLFSRSNTLSGIIVFFTQYRETPGPVSWRDAAWVPDEPHTGYSFRQPAPCLRPAAWVVGAPPAEVIVGKRAIRECRHSLCSTQAVPLFINQAPQGPLKAPVNYAVWNLTNQQLMVYTGEAQPRTCGLPASDHPRRTALRVGLLPFAIATDAALTLGILVLLFGGSPMGPGR